jgi:hypothetical protein
MKAVFAWPRLPRDPAGQNLVTESVYERPMGERPMRDSIDGIARWLNTGARSETSFTRRRFGKKCGAFGI